MTSLYEHALEQIEAGKLAEAESSLKLHLQANPGDAQAHNKLGVVYAKENRFQEAERCFEDALRCDPGLPHAYNNLGNLARQAGDVDKARAYYEKAASLDPDYSVPHHNLAVVYKQLNRYSDFIREMKLAKRLDNKHKLGAKKSWRQVFAHIWPKSQQ